MKKKILVIDDDIDMCMLLEKFLSRNGYETDAAYTGNKGIAKIKENKYDIVLCDYRLGDKDGKDVLLEIKKHSPETIVLIITGYSDIKTAVEVIKCGAYDYITKPLIPDEIINILNNISSGTADKSAFNKESNKKVTNGNQVQLNDEYLIGKDAVTKELYKQAGIVAPTNYSVVLYGESGTGKEVLARTIHNMSSRSRKPFVPVDCGTLSKELAGSELFGHVKGAFTGALNDKQGQFEIANGGTVFLDEIVNLPSDVQMTLLRAVQERKIKRVGSNKEMDIDVRIIVASNEKLTDACEEGKFREDLYHRFNEFSIILPPLRERKDDIILFSDFFLNKTNMELGKNVEGFEDDVMEIFQSYQWPGNLREYRNVIRRSVLLTPHGKVKSSVLPVEILNYSSFFGNKSSKSGLSSTSQKENISTKAPDLKDAASRAEYETIMETLKKVKYNKTKAAELLNIDRKTLYNKLRNFEELQ